MTEGDLYRSKYCISLPTEETKLMKFGIIELDETDFLLDLGVRFDLGADLVNRWQRKMLAIRSGKIVRVYEDFMSDFEKVVDT